MPVIKTDKEAIVLQSIQLFKLHGYYSTTMADIGEACGLIKGSIYHYFRSKEELALECLKQIHSYFDKEIFSIARDPVAAPQQKLRHFCKAVERYFLNSKGGCLLGNFALEISNNIPLLKAEIVAYFTDWEKALYNILRPAFSNAAARAKARQIVSATQGNIMLMRLYGSTDGFKAHIRETSKLLD